MTTIFQSERPARVIVGMVMVLIFLATGWPGQGAPATNAAALAAAEAEQNDVLLAPFYTGTIYPTPQQATYHDQFAPLASVGLVLGKDVKPDDPRLAYLMDRIQRYGGTTTVAAAIGDAFPTYICVSDTPAADAILKDTGLPDKPEGYIIRSGKQGDRTVILLRGKDKLGLLWAVQSFNQLVTRQEGRPAARLAEVTDYPAIARRGVLAALRKPEDVHVMVGAKINFIDVADAFTYRVPPLRGVPNLWRKELPERGKTTVKMIGDILTPLGIEWYASLRPLAEDKTENQPRCKNEDDFQAMLKHALFAAELGGNFSLHFDDMRFPLHPDDVKDFGSAKEADIYLLNKLHKALKEKYPQARMLFCPPFYWGPGACPYTENREEYLKALGARTPKDMGIDWTGPAVKSSKIDSSQTKWIADLIQRKPLFYQNILFNHAYGYYYCPDPIPAWPEWHYAGFFEEVEAYMLNGGGQFLLPMLTLADFLWNPKAYDPEQSAAEITKHMFGPETYPALVELNAKLSFFDQYGSRPSPAAARDLLVMEQRMIEVDMAWSNALAYHPGAVKTFSGMVGAIQGQKNFLAGLKKNKDLAGFAKNVEPERKRAEAESGLNAKTDTFLSAYDFTGGGAAQSYAYRCEKRLATWVHGARSGSPAMKAPFQIEPFPPERDYQLIVSGQDDDAEAECGIKIMVNETAIFEGKSGFVHEGWSRRTFTIPAAALKRYNELKIVNLEDSDSNFGAPFFMLNYAIVRKLTEAGK
ncbi:MAG: beta-N-acetylglucosaminidase domain-containing protein [Kiritimatiellae bacterium]|nr:beta-N-acetylglucosaminidase domain-containing protein [Kiritimatiellia bacterium]